MSTSNAQRFLDTTSEEYGLALKQFWGRMLISFRAKTILANAVGLDGPGPSIGQIVSSKDVSQGQSWQNLMFGADAEAEDHVEGTELLGQQFEIGESNLTLDKPLVTHYDIPQEHVQISHVELLPKAGASIGRSLANKMDTRGFITGAKAADTVALSKNGVTIHNGGNVVQRTAASMVAAYPTNSTGATNFRSDIATLARLLDEDHADDEDRWLVFNPYIRQVLGNDTTIFNADFTREITNSLNKRTIGLMEGFNVLPTTTNLPTTNITNMGAKYNGDFTVGSATGSGTPIALVFCSSQDMQAGIGYVSYGGVQPVLVPDPRRGTFFMKGRVLAGWGVLAPWCAGGIFVHS